MAHNYTSKIQINDNIDIFYIAYDLIDNGLGQTKKKFENELFDDIPVFSFGPIVAKRKLNDLGVVPYLREAMRNLYKVPEIMEASTLYLENNSVDDKYLRRGEFGELILYHLLHEYFDADALISKIYFKDSSGLAAHGFDAVHVDLENEILWLGESKLYKDGAKAVDELSKDVLGSKGPSGEYSGGHFTTDFFNEEFTIIGNRLFDTDDNYPPFVKKLIDPNTKTLEKLAGINIALFAGYDSNVLNKIKENELSIDELEEELRMEEQKLAIKLEKKLNNHVWKENLHFYILLFPLESKYELVKSLHNKLKGGQMI